MEDDVQSQAEETAIEETQEQTTGSEDNGSEAVENTSEEAGKGDLRVPLKEEREKRQRLEMALNDPDFIFKQAQKLGLAGEPAQSQAPVAPLQPNEVRTQIRIEKALDKYPDLRSNQKLQLMTSALIQGGMDPVEAADEVFSLSAKAVEKAKPEIAKQAQTEISEKEKAQTVGNQVRTSSDAERLNDIQKRMKSPDRVTQERATLEWLKAKNEKDGVI